MLKVGITGGIGSGKSVICRVFSTLGIPVLDADQLAAFLMEHDPALVQGISYLFGQSIYSDDKLDRQRVSSIVFSDPALLQSLNALVHPATVRYARDWHERQLAPYTIKEAALFFEAHTDKDMDVMIGVSAPRELRIVRAMRRTGLGRLEVISRMEQQIDNDKKMSLCKYVVINDDIRAVLPQVLSLHGLLLAHT